MINLVVNGQPFTDFVNASATLSLSSMANDFSFTASAVDGFPPFKQGDLVEVSVNDVKKITGYIEQVSGSDRDGSHTVNYSGRDKTGDFIDSTMNVIGEIKASESLTLKKIIEIEGRKAIWRPRNLVVYEVVNENYTEKRKSLKNDHLRIEIGQRRDNFGSQTALVFHKRDPDTKNTHT